MAGEEEDYIIRLLQELRQFVSRVVRLRDSGSIDEALLAIVQARETLFGRPSQQFAQLPVDDQLALLAQGESESTGRGKRVAYAAILKEAGFVYQVREEDDLAASAFQLALYIQLYVAVESPECYNELRSGIEDLLTRIPADKLYPPVKALLAQLPS